VCPIPSKSSRIPGHPPPGRFCPGRHPGDHAPSRGRRNSAEDGGIRVEKVGEMGGAIRIAPFAGKPVDLPGRDVLFIHRGEPPWARLPPPPLAQVYEGLTTDTVHKIRREPQQGRPLPVVPPAPGAERWIRARPPTSLHGFCAPQI